MRPRFVLVLLLLPALALAAERPSPEKLSRALDALYRADSSKGRMSMTVTTPHYERTLVMDVWTRGMEDTLIRIRSPRKERGVSTLKKGGEMWNYLPKVKKTIRVPPSMMMGSWMGSDFTNDDLVHASTWEEDYTVEYADAEAEEGELCLTYTPKPKAPVTWSKVVACFGVEDHLPRRMAYYDEKGRKARKMVYDKVGELGGRRVPRRMTLTPLSKDKEGHRTVIEFEEMEYGAKVPDQMFSLTYLRRAR